MPDTPIAPVDLSGGGSSSDTQLVQGGDGNWYLINKTTGAVTSVQGVPGKSAAPSTKELKQDGNGNWVIVDTATGKATPVEGMAPTPAKPAPGPKTIVSGASSGDQFIIQTDPVTGEITQKPNPNYVPPASANTRAVSTPSSEQYIVTMNPDGTVSKQPNPNWVDPSIKEKLQALADQYNRDVANGDKTNQQAIALFDAQVSMLTAGQNAGQDAVKYAQDANANRVGPNFGAHFADALSGRGVNFQGSDFMYQTPDYQAIARQATAEAIKHLSPYAAQIAGTMAPPGGYAPSGGGGYAPPSGGEGAPAQGGAQAPTAAGIPLAPGVTRNAQGEVGWIGNDGRWVNAYTAPAPPRPGYGSYRPGG